MKVLNCRGVNSLLTATVVVVKNKWSHTRHSSIRLHDVHRQYLTYMPQGHTGEKKWWPEAFVTPGRLNPEKVALLNLE